MNYLVYETAEPVFGRIMATGSALRERDARMQALGSLAVLCGVEADEDLHRVVMGDDGPEVVGRPAMPAFAPTLISADGVDAAVLDLGGVEIERLTINGVPATVSGGLVRLTADVATIYEVKVAAWPYLDQTVQIEAVAP